MNLTKPTSQLNRDFIQKKVNAYVEKQMQGYQHCKINRPKVLHDSVHGTNIFRPHEIAFLDLPIIQRLRRISQTDVASFVFPAGNHTRFEHTVGVAIVAGQMIDSIYAKDHPFIDIDEEFVRNNCRIAALLHDCGHGPFSHLSEQLYASQFDDVRKNIPFKGASAHEIISYHIATSTSIRTFNQDIIKETYGVDIDLDFVGEMIIGYIDKSNAKNAKRGFAVEVINGPFDADKLDYILRDAHATGIRMALDLPRLMYTLNVIPDKEGINRLAIDISGVAALESIIFNKMMLTSTIYHHQKVRAVGCMLKGIIENSGLFEHALVFLNYTDDQVMSLHTENELVERQLYMIKTRMLPKRAFCFSSRTLTDPSKQRKIMEKFDNNEFKKDIIANIAFYAKNELGYEVQEHEIWIDSPKNPKFKEATQCLIKSEGSENNHLLLSNVFPTDDWVRAFSENKWQGFVYSTPDNCSYVAKASKYVLENVFEVTFNSFATKLCKIDDFS